VRWPTSCEMRNSQAIDSVVGPAGLESAVVLVESYLESVAAMPSRVGLCVAGVQEKAACRGRIVHALDEAAFVGEVGICTGKCIAVLSNLIFNCTSCRFGSSIRD